MPEVRLYDGFGTLDGGLDMGLAPELLQPNQFATGVNVSTRGGYARARAGMSQRTLNFTDVRTKNHFNNGIFQGACTYTAGDATQNSLIVSVGGRLFRIFLHQNYLVTDISPKIAVLITGNTNLPAAGNNVTLPVSSEQPFNTGDALTISGGSFTVVSTAPDTVVALYNGGATANPIPAGTSVQDGTGNPIYALILNLSGALIVDLWQAENYIIGVSPGQATFIFDGSSSTIAQQSLQQLPSGWVGVYAWGRNWLANVDKRTYVASDLVGDPSGSPSKQFVDAILYVTENNLLSGGGSFSIPANFGDITSMTTLPQLDNSLGIGPVLIGCQKGVFSNQAPTDRTTWQNLTYPIQSVAYAGFGPVGPYNHVVSNSDWWFRSSDGIRQFMAARRDFASGNSSTPQSFEVSPILDFDEPSLLLYGRAIEFDNRRMFTVAPSRNPNLGIVHAGIITQNLDTISTLGGKEPPAWESLNTGLSVFTMVAINDDGNNRAFAFALEPEGDTVDLWEFNTDNSQADDISITGGSTNNLIPANSTYDVTGAFRLASLVSVGNTYVLTWGANEIQAILPKPDGTTHTVVSPGIGLTTTFTFLNTTQIAAAQLDGVFRFFAVTADLRQSNLSLVYTHVQWRLDTRSCDFGDHTQLKKLITSEIYVDEITDDVTITVYFRPDDFPDWTLWATVPLCGSVKQCALIQVPGCTVLWEPSQTQYAARIMLPRPPETINSMSNAPMDRFFRCQFRLDITGHCRFKTFKAHAIPDQMAMEGGSIPSVPTCKVSAGCPENLYGYNSYSGNQPGIAVTGIPASLDFGSRMPRFYPGKGWQFPNPSDGLWYTVTVVGLPPNQSLQISDTGYP